MGHSRAGEPFGLSGEYYEDEVPDTLDLAERAGLGLHYLTEIIDPEQDYMMFWGTFFDRERPDDPQSQLSPFGACQAKAMTAMAYLRVMSGNKLHLEREAGMVDVMASMLGEDGLHWVPGGDPDRPWLSFIPEPVAVVHGQGRMVMAMAAWYQYTGDPMWRRRIDSLIDGMDRHMVAHRGDYAFFPVRGFHDAEYLRSCYTHRGWQSTSEPTTEKFGEEGSLFNHQGHVAEALVTWFHLSGNEQALRLAGELVRFLMKPKFWADWEGGEYPFVVGAEHAHWQGHFHGYINTLRSILEYAIATNDARLKAFVRDGYEWARQAGFARIGYVGDGQGCACGRLIGLAVKLSYAGIGDYWEDVDQYIRNHGVEMQITPEDLSYLRQISESRPASSTAAIECIIDKSIGGYAGLPTKNCYWLCCGPWGNLGLFYAWDGIVQYDQGTARINLLLNRASPWVDIQSHEPYEGKVVIRNKKAREIWVRIPLWVDRNAVRCTCGESELPRDWFGNYLRFQGVAPGDVVTVRFPMVETTENWTVPAPEQLRGALKTGVHTCHFRGNTLIDVSPPLVPGSPVYTRRTHYALGGAPLKKVTRYVSPLLFKW